MIVNLWMGFDDRARSDLQDPEAKQPPLNDPVTPGLFRTDDPVGPRTYELWSLYKEVETEQEVRDWRNDLNAEFPGQLRTIGSFWYDHGNMVGTELVWEDVTRDVTIQDPDWDESLWPQVANPDYQPDTELPNYDGREFINDPTFNPPTVVVQETSSEITGTTGNPIFPLHDRILQHMPDVGEPPVPATEVTDVNLNAGQAPRMFA